jgi:hypothetical protein
MRQKRPSPQPTSSVRRGAQATARGSITGSTEATRLSLLEVGPRTFEIPAELTPGRPFWPARWENPHALVTWRKGFAPCQQASR